MDPRHLFIDSRLNDGVCVYCGGRPKTRDHVPSKVLLDEPYPDELPVIGACTKCNSSFSLDEQYLACFIECVVCGTVEPMGLRRPKVKRVLADTPALRRKVESSRSERDGRLIWQPEVDRVRKVVLKLAQGHVAYELYPRREKPREVLFAPLLSLSEQERQAFEGTIEEKAAGWPEIGSRAFLRACGKGGDRFEQPSSWIVVQPGRYRYTVLETEGISVKMVLSEYLACAVSWE